MTTTNGHAAHTLKPGDLTPAVRPVKRTLYVEEEDNGIKSVWEATDDDIVSECKRRGILPASDEYMGESIEAAERAALRQGIESAKNGESVYLGSFAEHANEEVVGTTPSGEAVRMVGADRAEVERGKMPSERIVELHGEMLGHKIEPGSVAERCGWQVGIVAAFLDERLGRGT